MKKYKTNKDKIYIKSSLYMLLKERIYQYLPPFTKDFAREL